MWGNCCYLTFKQEKSRFYVDSCNLLMPLICYLVILMAYIYSCRSLCSQFQKIQKLTRTKLLLLIGSGFHCGVETLVIFLCHSTVKGMGSCRQPRRWGLRPILCFPWTCIVNGAREASKQSVAIPHKTKSSSFLTLLHSLILSLPPSLSFSFPSSLHSLFSSLFWIFTTEEYV